MRPILNNILVKPFPAEEKTESGLFVPESCRKTNDKVRIVAAGGLSRLKAGTTAHRVKDWGQEFVINGEPHFLMNENAILAIE